MDSDDIWSRAERRGDFRTFSPREDGDPRFPTEFRVAFDDRALYIFVRAFDPRPDSLVRLLSRRDTDGPPNDQIQLFIDSFNDRRSGYEYIVNAAGVKSDYILFDDTGFDQSWDGIWDVATQRDSAGWSAEYAIPLQQLRFSNRDAPEFGLMIWRLVGRTGERVSWPPYRPSRSGYMSQTGLLTGIQDLVRPMSLELAPYMRYRASNTLGATRQDATLGGELTFLPVPHVSVDATVNPDFGQVESDPAVLDLTGFEVFQAERRPFFLEGAGQFSFPLANDGISSLFYSRRIGRRPVLASLAAREDAPTETIIHAAAKVTGRLSPATSVALLSAVTGEEIGSLPTARVVLEPRAHYAVARLQHDFRAGRSGVGLMATRVDRGSGDVTSAAVVPRMAQAIAVAGQHQSSDGNYRAVGWLAVSNLRGSPDAIAALQLSNVHGFQRPDDGVEFDSTSRGLDGLAAQLFLGKVGGLFRWDATYRSISSGFDVNEMGFLTAAGVRNLSANAGVRVTRSGQVFGVPYRTASLMFGAAHEWAGSDLTTTRTASVSGSMQLNNFAFIQVSAAQQLPGAFCTMSCTRGGPALRDPPRSTIAIDVTGDPRRTLLPHIAGQVYRDDEGRSHGARGQLDVTWRARTNLDVSGAVSAEESTLDAFFYRRIGAALSDTARVIVARLDQPVRSIIGRVDYTMTTTLSLQWYVQAYVSRGGYSDLRQVTEPRATRYDSRFRPVGDTALTNHTVGVDFRQFRSNAVLRWEYRPGSALFVVWTQGRDLASSEAGRLHTGHDLRELFRRPPDNVIAVKASYWISR